MSWGQYSPERVRRTKAEQIAAAEEQGHSIVWSRKAGHNRVHFKTADGCQHYMLHLTVIISHNPETGHVTLRDGGWVTMTTREAWSQGSRCLGIKPLHVWAGRPVASHMLGYGMPKAVHFDREVVLALPDYALVSGGADDAPMIRAMVEGEPREFRYRGDGFVSTADVRYPCVPSRAMFLLRRALEIAKKGRDRVSWHRQPLYGLSEDLAGYSVTPGPMGRGLVVDCHAFVTADVRQLLRMLEHRYPDQVPAAHRRYAAWKRSRKAAEKTALAA